MPADAPAEPRVITCLWCAYADVVLKKVLNHMESTHGHRWCDLALLPLVAGMVV